MGGSAHRSSPALSYFPRHFSARYAGLGFMLGWALVDAAHRRLRVTVQLRRQHAALVAKLRKGEGSAASAGPPPLASLCMPCERYERSLHAIHDPSFSVELELEGLSHQLDGTPVLEGLRATLRPGRLTLVAAARPRAASALLRILGGLAPAPSRAQRRAQAILGRARIRINGSTTARMRALRKLTGLVPGPHTRTLRAHTTTQELVGAAAALRLPSELTGAERAEHVAAVLELLSLEDLADCFVGTLTPSELTRASVAVELVCDPALLLVEDPTPSLDPASALDVARALWLYARLKLAYKPCSNLHTSNT
ncbi:hypothetical protein T492DRAFT_382373 [Pavlovales sp. CCMP2436]|nr:hypothetical protein T492DRAFT_382373 [Pavlovales sp. CCMP2436]